MLIAKRPRGPPIPLRFLYVVPAIVVICAYVFFIYVLQRLCRHSPVSCRAGFPFKFLYSLYLGPALMSFAAYLDVVSQVQAHQNAKVFQYSCISVENVEKGYERG